MSTQKSRIGTEAKLDKTFDQFSIEDWQQIAEKSLRGKPLDSLNQITASELATRALYTSRPSPTTHIAPAPLQRWDNRLAVIEDSAQNQNANILTGLQGGNSSVQLHLNCAEFSRKLDCENLTVALNDVQLDILPISLKAGSAFRAAAKNLEQLWHAQGIAADNAQAEFNADPIGAMAAYGVTTHLETQLTDLSTLAAHTHAHFPKAFAVCVDTSCYHNAGASLKQELVASLATAAIYMDAMLDAGMSAQAAHDNIVFQVACDADVLSNVTKLRVLKLLWHHISAQMQVTTPTLTLVVETSQRMQSRLEPWVNHLRNISAATAAAMGGARSLVVHPHNRIDDQFIDKDIEIAARVARNIAIILSEESRLTFVHDPMGGAYAVENLTSELSQEVWQALQQLESNGGLVKQLQSGQFQAEIAETQLKRVARLIDEQDILVGVNRYGGSTPISKIKSGKLQPNNKLALETVRDALSFEVAS